MIEYKELLELAFLTSLTVCRSVVVISGAIIAGYATIKYLSRL